MRPALCAGRRSFRKIAACFSAIAYDGTGFSGSTVSSLSVKVEHHTELVTLLKSGYHGRMVDILDVGM